MTTQEHEQRFRQCLADHANIMWKVVRAFAVTRQDQEDLLQETALQLWRSLPTFRGEAKTSTWIYRIAFNIALVWKRNEKRRHAKHESFIHFSTVEAVTSGQATNSHDEEMVEQLYTAIRQLPVLDASLALMHLDGLSYREMSEVLGITEGNVGVKLNRIRKLLAEMLKGVSHES